MLAQLPLNIQLRDDATLESYYAGDNQQAWQAVNEISHGAGENFLYLWGKYGVGRSHLLQAACHKARGLGVAAVYIPLQESLFLSPQFVQGLENIPLVCLDDIQSIAGQAIWEETLFHLFNRIRAQNTRLLIAASDSPKNIAVQLPDLKSRLAWGVTYQLQALTDDQKLDALALRAHCRGLELSKTVGQFLLSRCPRNMTELFQTLEQLDKASLAEQRRLTIPFVKQVLGV